MFKCTLRRLWQLMASLVPRQDATPLQSGTSPRCWNAGQRLTAVAVTSRLQGPASPRLHVSLRSFTGFHFCAGRPSPGNVLNRAYFSAIPPHYRPLQRRYKLLIPKPLVGGSSFPGTAIAKQALSWALKPARETAVTRVVTGSCLYRIARRAPEFSESTTPSANAI